MRNDYITKQHFGAPLTNGSVQSVSTPKGYKPDLMPQPSHLYPHCLAKDRLRLWLTAGTSPRQQQLAAQSTKVTYGTGLLIVHDVNSIAEDQRCPVGPALLLTFLSSCVRSYSGSALVLRLYS
ncbi:hypothetical protein CY34DRAFT_101949, partial [Suillus luteus UH-Slu-Lm8-n1]